MAANPYDVDNAAAERLKLPHVDAQNAQAPGLNRQRLATREAGTDSFLEFVFWNSVQVSEAMAPFHILFCGAVSSVARRTSTSEAGHISRKSG